MSRTSTSLRVTVNRDKLLKALRAQQDKCSSDYEKALARYAKEMKTWPNRALDALNQLQKDVAAGRIRPPGPKSNSWKSFEAIVRGRIPQFPLAPTRPRGYADVIAMVEMSDKETVSLTEEQYAAYMKGCRL